MPKMKTHKGTRKRVKITARGKVMYFKRGGRHLLSHKSAKRKRQMRRPGILSETRLAKTIRRLIGEE